ncbi:MAG TPA: L,D-transpeptidase [Pyrinomonadaceae bacterium]|nr:L,D-transpeptidase [Pyrinomonadaceae bacterium]
MNFLTLILLGIFFFCLGTGAWLIARDKKQVLPVSQNPQIVIKKKERTLEVFDNEKLLKTYKTALGFEPAGDKFKRNEGRTPEGEYFVVVKNPKSKFYRSLGLNYPNNKDAERGLTEKLISRAEYDAILKANEEKRLPPQNTALGSEIYIHGGGTLWDWTWGCVALEDKDMKELFDNIPLGTRITVKP